MFELKTMVRRRPGGRFSRFYTPPPYQLPLRWTRSLVKEIYKRRKSENDQKSRWFLGDVNVVTCWRGDWEPPTVEGLCHVAQMGEKTQYLACDLPQMLLKSFCKKRKHQGWWREELVRFLD